MRDHSSFFSTYSQIIVWVVMVGVVSFEASAQSTPRSGLSRLAPSTMYMNPGEDPGTSSNTGTLQGNTGSKLESGMLPESEVPPSELGVTDFMDSMAIKGQFNGWIGYIDHKYYAISAGYAYGTPRVGVLIIMGQESYDVYKLPKSGPISVISENDGILLLKSIKGTWEQYPEMESMIDHNVVHVTHVTMPGGIIYHFNIRTRKFE